MKLEQGRHPNPPLRWLTNCALVLDCKLEDLVDDEQREWFVLDERAPAAPVDEPEEEADEAAYGEAVGHPSPRFVQRQERDRALMERKRADVKRKLAERARRKGSGR